MERRLITTDCHIAPPYSLVEQLPEPYRTTLVLRFYNDLPLADVAERQNINLPLVKYRVRHGLKLLREKFSAQGVTEADI